MVVFVGHYPKELSLRHIFQAQLFIELKSLTLRDNEEVTGLLINMNLLNIIFYASMAQSIALNTADLWGIESVNYSFHACV